MGDGEEGRLIDVVFERGYEEHSVKYAGVVRWGLLEGGFVELEYPEDECSVLVNMADFAIMHTFPADPRRGQ